MASVLNEIFNFSEPQRAPTAPNIPSTPTPLPQSTPFTPPAPLTHRDPSMNTESNPSSDSEGDDRDEAPSATRPGSPDTDAAFAINTARNLRLTADGEKSLLRFSQLDVKSALVYQQATLIKLNETYLHHGPATMTATQGSGTGTQLALTNEIKSIIDYRMRLIILSPRLSRYRSLGKGLGTGPGAILVLHLEEWLRTSSGINTKYFEGEAYIQLRSKVKNSSRYARSEFKKAIQRSVEDKSHITILLHDLTRNFEKWVKNDLRTPIALAVRIAFLQQVYHKDSSDSFWKTVDRTLVDIRETTASGDGPSTSDILVSCLDADERKYPAPAGSASARATLTSVWQSETQSSMDEFIASFQSSSK